MVLNRMATIDQGNLYMREKDIRISLFKDFNKFKYLVSFTRWYLKLIEHKNIT
jgi:hypothetical protein